MDEDELEKIREKKKKEMQDKGDAEQQEEMKQQAEAQKKAILRKTLEPEARERLNAIKMAKPQFAEQVEQQIIMLARSGRVQGKIGEDEIKKILKELKPEENDYDIKRR
ncbi:MAG: DNA-binding protein [Halobacteria archaeon]